MFIDGFVEEFVIGTRFTLLTLLSTRHKKGEKRIDVDFISPSLTQIQREE